MDRFCFSGCIINTNQSHNSSNGGQGTGNKPIIPGIIDFFHHFWG